MSTLAIPSSAELEPVNFYESAFCRLCCEENKCGINLFKEKFDNQEIFTLINMYLPISVQDDGRYPQTICPGCHIQLQATISFFDLLIIGQRKLRELINNNPVMNENEPVFIQESEDHHGVGQLYEKEHFLHQKIAGMEFISPNRRGRGRPRKTSYTPAFCSIEDVNEEVPDRTSKRKRKCPARLEESVNGKELEDVYVEEGVINPNEKESPEEFVEKDSEVIGHVRDESGEGLGEVLVQSNVQVNGPKLYSAIQFRCDLCDISFNRESKLQKHLAEKHEVQTNTSTEIDGSSAAELLPVKLEFDQKRRFVCPICSKKFRLGSSLKGHMLSRHPAVGSTPAVRTNIPIYPCESCDKTFTHLSSLAYHREAVHSNGRRYACNKCDKTFKHRQLLKRHQTVHSEIRAYKCDQCAGCFKTKANLLNHTATHTKDKKFQCGMCTNRFAYKTSLTLHIRSHTGQKPFECAVCQKRFTQKGNLKEHIRTHTGEKPFECEICSRKFTTSSQFTLHFKRHIGFKPWKCEYCEKSFLHKNTWRCHLRRHRGEKPYDCKICGKTFPELWALKKHIRLHTGEKPYACTTCGKSFSDCSNLKKHKLMHEINERKVAAIVETKKVLSTEVKLSDETNSNSGEEMWTLISRDTSNDVAISSNRNDQIIYVTYQNAENPNSRLSEKLLISKDDLEQLAKEEQKVGVEEVQAADELNGIFVPTMQVMDEHGNPFKFASDGTLFQVTTMDGEPLQVALGEDEQFPLTIAANGESIIHQIKPLPNLPIGVGSIDEDIAVAPRSAEGIEFVPDDQHFKLISDLNTAALNLTSEYLEIV